jgi:transposase
MRLITLLNHCQHFTGFVYGKARLCQQTGTIEIDVRPRRGSKPVCSGCHRPAPGYDHLGVRRFDFIPLWGFMVQLLYRMRRVDCSTCGVRVEEVPWAIGKHQLTKAYMVFLAHWARRLSWKETAIAFRTTWDKVFDAVRYVVEWGLVHRELGQIRAIGVDEIQYSKGHKYLTLVYQIEEGCTRLLWIGKDRTVESFEQFFNMIGKQLCDGIEFV